MCSTFVDVLSFVLKLVLLLDFVGASLGGVLDVCLLACFEQIYMTDKW